MLRRTGARTAHPTCGEGSLRERQRCERRRGTRLEAEVALGVVKGSFHRPPQGMPSRPHLLLGVPNAVGRRGVLLGAIAVWRFRGVGSLNHERGRASAGEDSAGQHGRETVEGRNGKDGGDLLYRLYERGYKSHGFPAPRGRSWPPIPNGAGCSSLLEEPSSTPPKSAKVELTASVKTGLPLAVAPGHGEQGRRRDRQEAACQRQREKTARARSRL